MGCVGLSECARACSFAGKLLPNVALSWMGAFSDDGGRGEGERCEVDDGLCGFECYLYDVEMATAASGGCKQTVIEGGRCAFANLPLPPD